MRYRLSLSPETQRDLKTLPGNYRQRIRKLIQALADDPRPPNSKELDFVIEEGEVRRIRVDHWRIVYSVIETAFLQQVVIAGIRRRPPYDYDDIPDLFQ